MLSNRIWRMTCLVNLFDFVLWEAKHNGQPIDGNRIFAIVGALVFLYLYLHLSDKARSGNA